MSFFDEADEAPRTEIRTPSRPSTRRRNSGGSGSGGRRRPPSGPSHQSIATRRAIAVVGLIIVIVLIAVGVNSCQSSARKSALQDYANNVNSLMQRSSATSATLFGALTNKAGNDASQTSNTINTARASAQKVLTDAQGLHAPSAATSANDHLLLALKMRLDGITNIAGEIQPALSNSVSQSAVKEIASQMARFYASDVLYKDYIAPGLVSALHANDIAVGGTSGVPINDHQFLPSLTWLSAQGVGSALGVAVSGGSGSSGTVAKGLHGDSIGTVSVGGTALTPGGTNTVTASPPPTFDVQFTNGGDFNESDVVCKVSITGQSVGGSKTVPLVDKGATATCAVTFTSAPPTGTYNVVATVEKVPGEKNLQNNTATFPVTFN